jgi:hypothetical protein
MIDTDVVKLVDKLRQEGIAAETGQLSTPDRGQQFGLVVGGHFYPLWELNEEGNEGLVQSRDFDAIRNKRPSDWTFARKII